MNFHHFFASSPKYLEPILLDELNILGVKDAVIQRAGVKFTADIKTAYKCCLWSRVANRIFLPIGNFPIANEQELYQAIQSINWQKHFTTQNSFAIDFSCSQSNITHSQFGAQKTKDAIVDQFRSVTGERPSVDTNQPDIRINVYLFRNKATVSLDLSGESLHKRAYRQSSVRAPLKENLAAALLLKAKWPEQSKAGISLYDPMCGSGTLLLEAALIAADIAPGLLRNHYGFMHWQQHDEIAWNALLEEAKQKRESGLQQLPTIIGSDINSGAIKSCKDNIVSAGLANHILVRQHDFIQNHRLDLIKDETGLIMSNLPYGERLSDKQEIAKEYAAIGKRLKGDFKGWKAGLLIHDKDHGFDFRIRSQKPMPVFNGALECFFLQSDIKEQNFLKTPEQRFQDTPLNEAELSLANRFKKNQRAIKSWLKQQNISCYRLYDADIPEYAAAIDIYIDVRNNTWVHIQEYEAPKTVDKEKAKKHLDEIMHVVVQQLDVPLDNIVLKVRRKQKGTKQYEKVAEQQKFITVQEGKNQFLINLHDYLDTGLFLDHRITRQLIADNSENKDILNLFAYTGTASVYAATAKAKSTTTVDLSSTYLDWAKQNLRLNAIPASFDSKAKHQLIKHDCIKWLEKAIKENRKYDLIFLDPPSFSNSKSMDNNLDIQRDHVALIKQCSKLLKSKGLLIFSTNKRKFKLEEEKLAGLKIENMTKKTLPKDFSRRADFHQCWTVKLI